MDYDQLRLKIQNSIKGNASREITGFLLQEVLLSIVDTLGDDIINASTAGGNFWYIDEATKELRTDKIVRIKKNLIVEEDSASAGLGVPSEGGGGATALEGLTDVFFESEPSDGDVLTYDKGYWKNKPLNLDEYYNKSETDTLVSNSISRISEEIVNLSNHLSSMWFIDKDGNLRTKYNVVIEGDSASGGTGEETDAKGTVTSVKVGDVTYSDVTAGVLDMTGAFEDLQTKIDLTPYLKIEDALNTYAQKTAVESLQQQHNALRGEFNDLNNLLNSDVEGVINTWNEVKDFLDEYSGSEDLATILSGINGNIQTLQGYFDNGIAKKATADAKGNVIDTYYTPLSSHNSLVGRVNPIETWYNALKDILYAEGGDVKINTNLIVTKDTASGGAGDPSTSGFAYLGDLLDVEVPTPSANDVLRFNGSKWVNVPQSQIAPDLTSSMITNALGYTPYNASNPNGYITASALSGYATNTALTSGLSGKVDKVSGKGLSTNDFTTILLTKLNGIASGAQVNVQSDWSATSGDAFIKNKPTSLPASDVYAWAKKSSLAVNDVPDLSSVYLPLAGGKIMTGTIKTSYKGSFLVDESGNGIIGVDLPSGEWSGVTSGDAFGTVVRPTTIRSSGDNLYHYNTNKATAYKIVDANNIADMTAGYAKMLTTGTYRYMAFSATDKYVAFGDAAANSGLYSTYIDGSSIYLRVNKGTSVAMSVASNANVTFEKNIVVKGDVASGGSGAATTAYLPLAGGTMVSGAGIYNPNAGTTYGAIGFNLNDNSFGSPTFPTIIRSSVDVQLNKNGTNYTFVHSGNIGSYALPKAGGNVTGKTSIGLDVAQNGTGRAQLSVVTPTDNPCDFILGAGASHYSIAVRNSTEAGIVGPYGFAIYSFRNSAYRFYIKDNGETFITNPLTIQDNAYIRGLSTNPYIRFTYGGQNWHCQAYTTNNKIGIFLGMTSSLSLKVDESGNVTYAGTISGGSDIRYKAIKDYHVIDLDTMANAPLFTFRWTNREDNDLYLGSAAQYWESEVPWVVRGVEFKTLDYATLGVAMGISLARKTLNHEERIKILEDEKKELKEEVMELNNKIRRLENGICN